MKIGRTVEWLEENLNVVEFNEWRWFLRELSKAEGGDKNAFTAATNFAGDSLDAEILSRLTNFKPSA